ncbi:Hypothetical predicted protein [Mytilus galloprovincialis]|uniref:Uncharacterized protein n=1 Tax=Mytilus galloprovincialis TaxID=29158 RepID=A0A8B6F876_MYTGA|nr:Hypothetical predicted protein [Mytilus galloprovincialis]
MSFQLNVDDFPPLIDPVDKMGIKNFLNNFKFSNKLANKNVGIKPVTVNTNNAETETIRQSKQSLRQKPKAKNKRPVSNIGTCGSSSKYVPKINLNYCLVPDSFTLSLHNSFDVLSISDKKENCHSVKISDTGEIPHGNKDKIPADYNNRLCNTSDKRTSLHIQAFAELKKFKTCTSHDENKLEENVQLNDGNVLKKAAEIIKLKIQSSCKIIKNSSNRNLSNFKFHDFIENTIDPILWNFLCSLIGQETQLQLPFGENSLSEDSVQFSQIFNICCCLIFNRDSKCNKFQMLIADIIDKFTNSSTDCFNLLNKFGICVSKQTYERYQTQIVEERKSNSINSSKCQFQIASVDNINKRSSYAAVKSTDAHRGFDGTSIQLVIPKPSIELLPEEKQQYLKGHIYLYGKDEYRSINLFPDNDFKVISLYKSIAILMNYGLLISERDNDGICNSDIEKVMENCLTNTVMDQSLREILSDPYYLSDENFSKVSKFSPDEDINHELYLFNTRRESDLVDLAAVSFATGCCIYIYEINTKNPLNQNHLLLKKKINPMFLTNHSFHIMEVDGKYCPLINQRLYFDSGIFLMSKNITDVSDFKEV